VASTVIASPSIVRFFFNTDVDATLWPLDIIVLGDPSSPDATSVNLSQLSATQVVVYFDNAAAAAGESWSFLATPPQLTRDMTGIL
jgi:hypothetical protein